MEPRAENASKYRFAAPYFGVRYVGVGLVEHAFLDSQISKATAH